MAVQRSRPSTSSRSGGAGPLEIRVDDSDMKRLMRTVREQADAKQLRKDLTAELRTAVAPGVVAVQAKLRSIPHRSIHQSSPSLGSALAPKVKAQVRLSGRASGVRVRIPQTPKLRGFRLAARRLNRPQWRHRLWGRDEWVTQQSPIPGFFDKTLAEGKAKYRAAVISALKTLSDNLAKRG